MSTVAVASLQTAWDCKWSRPGYRLSGVEERLQPESLWVCARTAARVPIKESDCETCPYWEQCEGSHANVGFAPRLAAEAAPAKGGAWSATAIQIATLRTLLLVTAAAFAYSGFALLTSALVIPLTIAIWACAVAMFGLGVWGQYSDNAIEDRAKKDCGIAATAS